MGCAACRVGWKLTMGSQATASPDSQTALFLLFSLASHTKVGSCCRLDPQDRMKPGEVGSRRLCRTRSYHHKLSALQAVELQFFKPSRDA